jgi:hypothetical protein
LGKAFFKGLAVAFKRLGGDAYAVALKGLAVAFG